MDELGRDEDSGDVARGEEVGFEDEDGGGKIDEESEAEGGAETDARAEALSAGAGPH